MSVVTVTPWITKLNDSALHYEPETSQALGFGFRCGFLGMLHMEIVQERPEREFDLDLITTAPGVSYRVVTTGGEEIEIHNPSKLPAQQDVEKIEDSIRALDLGPIVYLDSEGRVVEIESLRVVASSRPEESFPENIQVPHAEGHRSLSERHKPPQSKHKRRAHDRGAIAQGH